MQPREIPAIAGIYKIINTINAKFYIGSSNNVRKRCMDHFRELRKFEHYNMKLQNSWNKYGEDYFEFELVESCHVADLLIREQHHLDTQKPAFNINPCANGGNGSKRTEEQIKSLSVRMKALWADPDNYDRLIEAFNKTKNDPEVRKRQSEAALEKFEKDPSLKKKHSEVMKAKFLDPEYKARVRAAMVEGTDFEKKNQQMRDMWADPVFRENRGVLTDEQVVEILTLRSQGRTYPEIAAQLSVSAHNVRSVWRGQCYCHIDRTMFDEAYVTMKEAKRVEKLKEPQPRLSEQQKRLMVALRLSGLLNREIGDIIGVKECVVVDFNRIRSYKNFDRDSVVRSTTITDFGIE